MLPLLIAAAAVASPISADRIREHDRMLSSDAFLGRGPGEEGERRTIDYLAAQFAAAGLEPAGENGGWFQKVPLIRLDRLPGATVSVAGRPLTLGREATLALRYPGRRSVADAPILFAGFGVVDRERGWDAFRGVDMRGKVALLLANDPDYEGGRDLGFDGRRMALSGRVGEKVAAAMRAGALAAFVIHEDGAASYPFAQVASGDRLPAMVPGGAVAETPLVASGWLREDVGAALLARAGLTLAAAKQVARDPGFQARPIPGATLSLAGEVRATPFTSHNVIGRLRGASRPDETVLYGAHWDANGRNGPDASGDAIRNGAIDNAAGTSELIEVARAFARGPRPARTLLFAAWTAEEKGLLGADYYAEHPVAPLATTALVVNLDPHLVLPAARTLELIGGGRTPLEGKLARVAATQGLRLVDEPAPEAGWYFRSDHFPFARRGVPTVAFRIGRELKTGPAGQGAAIVARYNRDCYHQPCDQFDPRWTFAGAAQEATVAWMLGRDVAGAATWPGWNAGNEYEAVRAKTVAERTTPSRP